MTTDWHFVMPDANVTNVAALSDFRCALAKFALEARQALTDIELEVRRALDWIRHDRAGHWNNESRRAVEAIAQAKDNLANSRTFKRIGEHVPTCVDEKKAVESAKRRLALAEEKMAAVRHWSHAAPRAVDEFQGPVQALMGMLDGDLPRAVYVLERMTAALERYAATGVPLAIKWEDLVGKDAVESVARPVEEEDEDRADTTTGTHAEAGGA